MTYRCTRCGNNILSESGQDLECSKYCGMKSGFIQVTEENKYKIPFPTNPYDFADPDKEADNSQSDNKYGVCPCGVFVAHVINKKCDFIETTVPKEPMYDHCQCKASVSFSQNAVSHRLTDPCTGKP